MSFVAPSLVYAVLTEICWPLMLQCTEKQYREPAEENKKENSNTAKKRKSYIKENYLAFYS